jgi:starch synthase
MKIVFIASEGVPFVKSGGLADVVGSLPKALRRLGADVSVILPKHSLIPEEYSGRMRFVCSFCVKVGWRNQYCGVFELLLDGLRFYFIDNEYYFKRDKIYGYGGNYDEAERYSYFSRAALEALEHLQLAPDLIHTHDWHTGAVPYLLKTEYQGKEYYKRIRTVFTIHNLQYQGIFPKDALDDLLGGRWGDFTADGIEFYGNVNYMKAGLNYADRITTVSPTYALEIQTPYFGEQLDGLLRRKAPLLSGIVNGIDDAVYNPAADCKIIANYDRSSAGLKQVNKWHMQERFRLPVLDDVPVIAMISRLTEQKGLDLILRVLDDILAKDVQMIVLGAGDCGYEEALSAAQERHPGKLRACIGFDEDLARQIYAGADLFLMPSRFEPCGLGQLIAMRYGAVPIVRETGGLNDTVQSYNEATGEGNGFRFANYNAHDMLAEVERAVRIYEDKEAWRSIVKEAMSRDSSWGRSASQYMGLYRELVGMHETSP